MSRFADATATRTVPLGPCECPGTPHESDWAKVRKELSGSDIGIISNASATDEVAAAGTMAPYVIEWNLLGPNGEPWPPSAESLLALNAATLGAVVGAIQASIAESAGTVLPNASGAPSRNGSRGSASRTRTTPTRR